MTVVTRVGLKPGTEGAWHRDPAFRETRQRLDGLEARPAQELWHEVVEGRGLAA